MTAINRLPPRAATNARRVEATEQGALGLGLRRSASRLTARSRKELSRGFASS